ncbi:MAG: SpoIIE family protein phosphatase [Bacteroidales bacterium]|nr:SpoIIE family protein phosphatase [Bacteroidales bacterium]
MTNNYKKILLFLLLFIINISLFAQKEIPKANKGVIDLREWNFTSDGNIKLEGEWEFYWLKLYTPNDFKQYPKPDLYVNVPGSWTDSIVNNGTIPDTGFATYRLIILSDTTTKYLSLALKEIVTAYRIWLNGEEITSLGFVGKNSKENQPAVKINLEKIHFLNGENELIIQVSNYEHRSNSFVEAPAIGIEENIDKEIITKIAIDLFVLGFLIIMAFYHLGLFILNKNNKLALIFAIFAFIVSVRTLVTSNFLISQIFSFLSWKAIYFISYSSYYIAFPLIMLYIQKTFEEKKFKWVFNFLYISSGIFMLTLILPSIVYTKLLMFYQIISLFFVLFAISLLIKYVIKAKEGAIILLISVIIAALTFANDILFYTNIIKTGTILPIGLFILFLGQALTLSKIFASNFSKNEELKDKLNVQNQDLQSIVNKRTEELNNQKIKQIDQNKELGILNNQLRKYFVAIEQLPISVVITNKTPNIEYVNSAYTNITQYTQKELFGKNPSLLKSGKTPKETIKNLWETILQGKIWTGEFINKSKDNNEFIERAIITPIFNNSGEITNYLALKENITEIRVKENHIKQKNKKLSELYSELKISHNHLIENIEYSLKLQNSLLPDLTLFANNFAEYFIIFKPKSKVSGDFYFFQEYKNKIFFAIGDCTGHGIPGGFMTILSISNLKQIIFRNPEYTPAEILEELRFSIKSIFKTFGTETQDGLDLAFCCFEKNSQQIVFSGANLPLILIKKNQITEYKGVRNPIGFYPIEKSFINTTINIEKNDLLYMFSDGLFDQFNSDYSKFTKKRFIDFISENQNFNLLEQKNKLELTYENWEKNMSQIDDVCVLGIKI